MEKKSLVKNFIFNFILNTFNMLYPLIMIPFVSKIIGPDGIGKVSFADSVTSYFVTAACLGIPLYGIREISKVRDNKEKLNEVFSNIMILNIISTSIVLIVYLIMLNNVSFMKAEKTLFSIFSLYIIINFISLDWLFQGFENYKFIAVRSVVVKLISLIIMFVFLKSKEDYSIYALITVIGVSGSNIINFIEARKYVKISLKNINLIKYIKPIVILFSTQLLLNLYLNITMTMTGFLSNSYEVGYYTAAVKIIRVVIFGISSIYTVMTPRLCYYYANDSIDKFYELLSKTLKCILFISIPSSIGLYFLSERFTILYLGYEFFRTSISLKLLAFGLIFMVLNQFLGNQILVSVGKEKKLLINMVIGTVFIIISNCILIPHIGSVGAAISLILTEFIIFIINIYWTYEYIKDTLFKMENIKYIIASISIVVIVNICNFLVVSDIIFVIVSVIVSSLAYFSIMYMVKDQIIMYFRSLLLEKLKYGGKNE